MKWTNKGHEYDEIAKVILDESPEYYIWGAAISGRACYKFFKKEINIVGFIDSNPQKQGKKIGDVEIYNPSVLDNRGKNSRVLVASVHSEAIFQSLKKKNFSKDVDCFFKDDFMSIYMLYKYNKLYTMTLFYTVTTRCPLRCKHCMALIPYHEQQADVPVEKIVRELDKYFTIVDHVNVMNVNGGDVFIHKDLDNLLEQLGSRYHKTKINQFTVFTNGIFIPSDTTLKLLKKYDMFVRFTDYSKTTNLQRAEELVALLKEYKIQYDFAELPFWTAHGYPQKDNGLYTEEEWVELFNTCKRCCVNLTDNKVSYCITSFKAAEVGHCPLPKGDYIDLDEYTPMKKKELLEFITGYTERGYLEFCKSCNGTMNTKEMIVPVAEQLP